MTHNLSNALGTRPLVLDGALGTLLEERGIDTSGKSWTARAIAADPQLIAQIHLEYLRAGADIITANTFRTNPRALRDTGLDPETLTKTAVRIARDAQSLSAPLALVAASIAPVEDCFSPELVPQNNRALIEEHRIMAHWLAEAGVDIILIETMSSLREALCALQAVRGETDIDPWVSIVPKDGETMLYGTPLGVAVEQLAACGAQLVALNCAPVSIMERALPTVSMAAKKAVIGFGCYPNASEKRPDGSWDLQSSTDRQIAVCIEKWLQNGAAIVGSCCGTTHETTHAIANLRDRAYPDIV